jgi:hypothetical protein
MGLLMNAKIKRSKRGCEKRWNRFSEPFTHLLSGKFMKTKSWIGRKITKKERKYNSHLKVEDY